MTELISVIVPTFNRYNLLIDCLYSLYNQTYKNMEVIIIDDASSDERYFKLGNEISKLYPNLNFKLIRNIINSSKIKGFPCAAYSRNKGLEISKGNYIAFCDDDDFWLPYKLDVQLNWIKKNKVEMCATDAFYLDKPLDDYEKKSFDLSKFRCFNNQHFYSYLSQKLNITNFPFIIDKKLLEIHNIIINSSVLITRELYLKIGKQDEVKNGQEDYSYWLRCLNQTNCVYIHFPCLGYIAYNTKFY